MSTYEAAADLGVFNTCLDELAVQLVRDDLGLEDRRSKIGDFVGDSVHFVDEEKIQKCGWIASVLALSPNDDHRRKALAFGILSHIRARKDNQPNELEEIYRRYLYIILSRLGNLPAFDNVQSSSSDDPSFQQELLQSVDSVLATELATTRSELELGSEITLSKFQYDIYNHLVNERDVAISGPTSSGKSFILKRFIKERVNAEERFEAIYVVPTRALITEVCRDLSKLEGVTVRPGIYFEKDDEINPEKAIQDVEDDLFLVVTPERCRKIVNPDVRSEMDPDLVFFDEVQNIEDDERGVLFEGIVELLNQYYPTAQIVAAGPYLDNPGETLENLTNSEVAEVQSAFTPVLQLKVSLKFRKGRNNDILANVHSPSDKVRTIEVSGPDDLSFTNVKNSKTQSLPSILDEFAPGDKSLVYSGKKNLAENRAKRIADSYDKKPLTPKLEQLKSFLERAIHQEYSLIDCIEHGVAFHHGNVPKFAREEIEEIYSDPEEPDALQTIITTPTLMQGVNLPAEKIFLVAAKKGSDDLTDFEFNNLIGRVGRMDTKLYGSIYCIETEDDEWADEKLGNTGEKEVKPATDKALDDVEDVISALKEDNLNSVKDSKVKYTAILLRGRHLKDDKSVSQFLEEKDVDETGIERVESTLNETLNSVDIPHEYLRKNPTIDPVKLDELYKLVQDDLSPWIIENRYQDFYDKLLQVARNLNIVFKFTRDPDQEIIPRDTTTECPRLIPIVVNANHWLQGSSYSQLIESRRNLDSYSDEKIDKSIRKTMNLVDQDICFHLVRYFSILTSILEDVHEEETPSWMLQIDSMLEMGSMNVPELKLMSVGVDRSVAVDIGIPAEESDPTEWIQKNKNRLRKFHRKHLENQDLI